MGKILIMGADKPVGFETLQRLARVGPSIRAAFHNKSKMDSLSLSDAQRVLFDFSDRKSIEQALDGVSELFLITPDTQSLLKYVHSTLQCAAEAGVAHIVYLSIFGAQREGAGKLARWHAEAQEALESCGIAFTILKSNCLMQNFLSFIQPKSGTIYLPLGEASVSLIDARDVAAVAADIMLPGAHHYGKTYLLTGPQACTGHMVADSFTQITGEKIGYVDIPPETARPALEKKFSPPKVELILDYFQFLRSGGGSAVSSAVEQIAGFEPVSFIDFSRDYAQNIREKVAA